MKLLGTKPKHWDAESFEYEVRFDAPPSDEQLEALARAWSAHLVKAPTRGGAWRFSGPFAYFNVQPKKDAKKMFADVESFLRKANEIATVAEAINLMAAEDFADLDPGPDLPHSQRPVGDFPAPAAHPIFQAVQKAIRLEKLEAQYGKWVAEVPAGKLGLAFADEVPALAQDDVSEGMRAIYPEDDGMQFHGVRDRPRRIPIGDARIYPSLYLVVDGAPKQIDLDEGTTTRRISVPHPGGETIAVPAMRGRAHVVLTASCGDGSITEVWAADDGEEVRAVAWLTGAVLAIQTSNRALAVDTASGKTFVGPKGNGYLLHSLQGGRLLWRDKPQILAWNGKKLTAVSAFKAKGLFVESDSPDGIVVRSGAFQRQPGDVWMRVTGLEEVLAKKCIAL